MISLSTFNKMNKLTNLIKQYEREELLCSPKEEEALNELTNYASSNYNLIKVKDCGINNYHFELRKKNKNQ